MIKKIINDIREADIYEILLIYICLLFSAGFYFFEFGATYLVVSVGILLALRISAIRYNGRLFSLLLIMLSLIIVSCTLSSYVYRNEDSFDLNVILTLAKVALAFFVAYFINLESFKRNYIICLLILSVFSLGTFVISLVDNNAFAWAPTLINSSGIEGKFLLFSIYEDFTLSGFQRNQSIFWEPGAFQVFLTIAYIFEITNEAPPRKYVLFIFLLSLVSTVSTTGIIVAAALLIYTLGGNNNNTKIIKILLASCFLMIGFYLLIPFLPDHWHYTLIDKIRMLFNYRTNANDSAITRVYSIIYPFSEFVKHPFIGLGEAGVSRIVRITRKTDVFTSTPVNWITRYGILYALLIYSGYIKFFVKISKSKLYGVALFLIMAISAFSETVDRNIVLLALFFYGFKSQDNLADVRHIKLK